jgi:hypothetical protein
MILFSQFQIMYQKLCRQTTLIVRHLSPDSFAVDHADYPIELLKNAGVDMTSAEHFDKMMTVMNRTMDEIEAVLQKKRKLRVGNGVIRRANRIPQVTCREGKISPGARILVRDIQFQVGFACNEVLGFHLCRPIVSI